MTAPKRDWLATFSDEAVLSDLFAAARDAMRQVCDHDPAECGCDLNRATFQEWAEWVEIEVRKEGRKPVRIEPAGRPGRRKAADRRTLGLEFAAAG